MGKTSIEWATYTWSPTTGCTRVSDGCDNCYAFALHDRRYAGNLAAARRWSGPNVSATIGPIPASDLPAYARRSGVPLPWPRQYDLPFSRVQLFPDRLDWPLRHRKPERIFVDSMSDLFHEDVPDELINRVFDTMEEARQHTFLVLTKRPDRMQRYVDGWYGPSHFPGRPLSPNVWLGTSVEDQAAADEYARSSRDTYLQRLSSRRLVVSTGRGEVRAAEQLFA